MNWRCCPSSACRGRSPPRRPVADRVLASLRLGCACVAEYADGAGLEPNLAPRPHLHPIRTLGGRLVTDALPADHRWHLGLSVAVPDVGGWNFWGGPTYLRDRGYTLREDHGRIEHVAFTALTDEGFGEQLRWLAPGGEPVLAEHRRVRAQPADSGWILQITTSLTNVSDGALALGSPATNGRPGAGYGGLFWRLPPTQEPSVRTDRAAGGGGGPSPGGSRLGWHDPGARLTLAPPGAQRAGRRGVRRAVLAAAADAGTVGAHRPRGGGGGRAQLGRLLVGVARPGRRLHPRARRRRRRNAGRPVVRPVARVPGHRLAARRERTAPPGARRLRHPRLARPRRRRCAGGRRRPALGRRDLLTTDPREDRPCPVCASPSRSGPIGWRNTRNATRPSGPRCCGRSATPVGGTTSSSFATTACSSAPSSSMTSPRRRLRWTPRR